MAAVKEELRITENSLGHHGPISGVATSAGLYVATAGYDNQVILWDAATKTARARVLHDHLANQCAFNSDGTKLVSASSDYTARVWDVPSLRLTAVLHGHEDDVEMAVFNDAGTLVATCSRDRSARVFDTGGRLVSVCRGHDDDVISVAWAAQGEVVLTSSDDGTVRRWDAGSGECLGVIDFGGVQTDTLVAVGDDLVLAGDDEGRITSIVSGRKSIVRAHAAGVKRLVCDLSGRRLISLSYDRSCALWEVDAHGQLIALGESEFPAIVWPRSCAFLDSGRVVFGTFGSSYALYDSVQRRWDTRDIESDHSLNAVACCGEDVLAIGDAGQLWRNGRRLRELGSLCNFLVVCGQQVLSGGQLGEVYGALSGQCLYKHRSPINCAAAFHRDGELWVVVGTYTGEGLLLRLTEADSAPLFVRQLKLHDNAVKGVAVSAGEIFSVCATGEAAFHDLASYECSARIPKAHGRIANGCAALGATGFASVGRDLKLCLWSGRQRTVIDTPHQNSIKCVAASDDGRYVATGSYVGEVAIYDCVERHWVEHRRPTAAGISCLTYDTLRRRFVGSSYDGRIYTVSP